MAQRLALLLGLALVAFAHAEKVVRVGMNWRPRNSERERLVAKSRAVEAADPSTDHRRVRAVETRIYAGEGSHTITVVVGGQPRELIIDTGSGKTAFVCAGCRECGDKHAHGPFVPTPQTKFLTCDPDLVGDEYRGGGCMECADDGKCRYGQRYIEGDSWEAYKASDELWFSPAHPEFNATVEFGCIYEQTGCFTEQTSDGIMGFSRHPDSIFEQFHRQGVTESRIFAQCLAEDGGALTLGGVDMSVNIGSVMYTPLRDTGYQYWTVTLLSVSIGDVSLELNEAVFNADRGCVFDSGTTFVYLPERARGAFVDAWREALGDTERLPVSESYHRIPDHQLGSFPKICFHFLNDARICMGPEAYFYRLGPDAYAGTIYFGDEAKSTIVGASVLAGHNIIYDVDNQRIGMAVADCDSAVRHTQEQQRMVALELHPGGDVFYAAIDREYWLQVALVLVTVVAVSGLVNVAWSEIREARAEQGDAGTKGLRDAEAANALLGARNRSEFDGPDGDFAFFLMQEHDDRS